MPAASEDKGVDLVIDILAGPLFNATMRATQIGGRIVNVGRIAEESAPVDFGVHSMRRSNYNGVTFRTHSGREVAELGAKARTDLGSAIAAGELTLPADTRYPLTKAPAAFAAMAPNRHFGKIVLTLD